MDNIKQFLVVIGVIATVIVSLNMFINGFFVSNINNTMKGILLLVVSYGIMVLEDYFFENI